MKESRFSVDLFIFRKSVNHETVTDQPLLKEGDFKGDVKVTDDNPKVYVARLKDKNGAKHQPFSTVTTPVMKCLTY